MVFANNRCDSEKDCQTDSQCLPESVSDEQSRYYGDTLYQFDGKTVIYDYSSEDDAEVSSLSSSALVTYKDTVPVDTCQVIGNGTYVADGSILKFAIGVDTIRYDMRHLPDSVNPTREILPANTVEHRYAHSFELTDSSWRCDFKFLAYLPENHPAWLNQFIATIMRNDIQALYLDNKGADRILKEYYGVKAKPKKVDGINAANMTPKKLRVILQRLTSSYIEMNLIWKMLTAMDRNMIICLKYRLHGRVLTVVMSLIGFIPITIPWGRMVSWRNII